MQPIKGKQFRKSLMEKEERLKDLVRRFPSKFVETKRLLKKDPFSSILTACSMSNKKIGNGFSSNSELKIDDDSVEYALSLECARHLMISSESPVCKKIPSLLS